MNIFQIAMNNLKRRKIKMLFLMIGLSLGVATVVVFANIIQAMDLDLGDRIDELGANAIIIPRSEGMQMAYDNTIVSELTFDVQKLTMDDIPKIYSSEVAEYINIVSPKLISSVEINNQLAIAVGVDTRQEFTQKPWLSLSEQMGLSEGEKPIDMALIDLPDDGLIFGETAAQALEVQTGDKVIVNGKNFTVYGILERLGSEEDGLVYANLSVFQSLLNRPNELSLIEISAYCNFCPIEEVAMVLNIDIPNGRTIPVRQAALFREETIEQFSTFGIMFSSIVLLISSLVVLITMLSAINERTREIGIFRAIGFRKLHVIKIISIEVVTVSFIGGLMGYLFGSIFTYYVGPYLAQIQGQITLRADLFLPAMLLSMGLAMVASIYPVLKAAKLDPVEALRFI